MAILPHGGKLINRYEPEYSTNHIQKEVELDATSLSDLELIGIGAYSPITGFLTEKDYLSVVNDLRLADGAVWSIPIVLPVQEKQHVPFQPVTK